MAKILVAYYYRRPFPPRASVRDHLNSFKKYAGHTCFYYNLGILAPPSWLGRIDFDLIIFHTTFLCCRWNPARFGRLLRQAEALKRHPALKIALPQDEFVYSEQLCDFIREFDIRQVYSTAPPSEWSRIYNRVDRDRVRFFPVLTGYLEDATLARIERLATTEGRQRQIDIGYRATEARPWLGRHSLLKSTIARVFQQRAPAARLTTDISTRPADTLLGDDWYRFLLRCKYTIGVEGGASLLDSDGSVRQRTEKYVAEHPEARFDEIEAACFAGLDGNLDLKAISPRHLEACATRTCQILIEGEYNGVLEAGRHYIPLKPDFSNLDDVLETVRRDDRRRAIVQRAYEDVVASGQYSYRRFVEEVLQHALPAATRADTTGRFSDALREQMLQHGLELWDRCGWLVVALVSFAMGLLARASRLGRAARVMTRQSDGDRATETRAQRTATARRSEDGLLPTPATDRVARDAACSSEHDARQNAECDEAFFSFSASHKRRSPGEPRANTCIGRPASEPEAIEHDHPASDHLQPKRRSA